MYDKMIIRYKMDMTVVEDGIEIQKNKEVSPIGDTIEYIGSVEQIKEKICMDIDLIVNNIEILTSEQINDNKI